MAMGISDCGRCRRRLDQRWETPRWVRQAASLLLRRYCGQGLVRADPCRRHGLPGAWVRCRRRAPAAEGSTMLCRMMQLSAGSWRLYRAAP